MKFEEKLIKLRKEHALSQEELGEKLNVTRQTVSKWELGKTTPEMSKLVEIAKIYNISVDELLTETENTTKAPKIENNNNEKNNKAIIIVVVLVVVLLASIGGIAYSGIKKMSTPYNENQNVGFIEAIMGDFKNLLKGIFDFYEKETEEMDKDYNNTSEEMRKEYNNMVEEMRTEYNNMVEETNSSYDISSYNIKYKNLYSGIVEKFFVETAIKNVIEDNLKNERKITVKYNDIMSKENKELTNLISSLNKKEYFITYEYDEVGYICQMNIQDI